jgi:hypothetical protein
MSEVEIINLLKEAKFRLVGIDGELGAGKTMFSDRIASALNISVIHVDEYLHAGRGKYFEAINFEALNVTVNSIKKPAIIEGVCLLYILKRLDTTVDFLVFLHRSPKSNAKYKSNSQVAQEVNNYIINTHAFDKADRRIVMSNTHTNELDVDVVYIKYNALVSVCFALGGIISLIVGSYILGSSGSQTNKAVFEILGATITTEGIGAVILSSSVLWAFFSYLSRPKYSRKKERKVSYSPDGSERCVEEFVSTTMAITTSTSEKAQSFTLPSPPENLNIIK